MMCIVSLSMNMYQLKEVHNISDIKIGNFNHVIVEYHISPNVNGETDILCWTYHP